MKSLVIGADPFPPYIYEDSNKNICGSEAEKLKGILQKMGYKAEFEIQEWSTVEKMFENGDIDLIPLVQKTPEREKHYYFSKKYKDNITSIITHKDNTNSYKNVNELFKNGSKLAVIDNYQYGDVIDKIDKKHKIAFSSLEEILSAVNDGKVSFGVTDLGVFRYLNKHNEFSNIKVIDNLNFNRPLYVMFNDKSIRDEFNRYL